MTTMDAQQVLALKMGPNDADATTVREYLIELLRALWRDEEGFSGKRPFGNSGWKYDVLHALVLGGAVPGKLNADGEVIGFDRDAAEDCIENAIDALAAEEPGA